MVIGFMGPPKSQKMVDNTCEGGVDNLNYKVLLVDFTTVVWVQR